MIQERIEEKLKKTISPTHLEVINESHNHHVPPGSESHFRVIVVSDLFESLMLVQRHMKINEVLKDELKNDIHALAIETWTSQEWQEKNQEKEKSPNCLGGSKQS